MRRHALVVLLAAQLLVLLPAAVGGAASPVAWRSERVDTASDRPWLALGRTGEPRVAYGTAGTVYYAVRSDVGWQTESVAPGSRPVLALDAADEPHLVYDDDSDPAATAIRYRRRSAGVWTSEVVDTFPSGGTAGGLAVGADGTVHATYYRRVFNGLDGALHYARRDPDGHWTKEVIVQGGSMGKYHGLALDGSGVPHVSIGADTHFAGAISHAWRGTGGWTVETASPAHSGQDNAIALDLSGQPRIAYFEAAGSNLLYAARSDTSWTTDVVVDRETDVVGRQPSLAIDQAGEPRIMYEGSAGLEHARREGAHWIAEVIDTRGSLPSLAMDAAGAPHTAYLAGGELRYAAARPIVRRGVLPIVLQRTGP